MAEEEGAGGHKPSTEEKVDALHDAMGKLADRMDAFMAKHSKRDDDDKRKDAKKDKDFKEWAKEEGEEEEHKDDDKRKDAEEEGEESPVKEKAEEDPEHERAAEKDDKRKDDKRKDAKRKDDDDDEGEGEPEPMASDDDRRRDRRKDDDDDDDDDRRRDSRADAATIRTLQRQMRDLTRMMQRGRDLSDDDLNAVSESQVEWDRIAQAHGIRAPKPMTGENITAYNRRMLAQFKKHSPRWAKTDFAALPAELINQIAAPEVRVDAMKAATSSDGIGGAYQRKVERSDPTGRKIIEFYGPIGAENGTLAPFRLPRLRVKRINTNPNQY